MFVAIGVGIYVRYKGIGKWPFADDEYYIAKSVKNILTVGLPKFECGGYYVRGLFYQYLAVPFFYFFSSDEFYLRIIPATSNILAIPALYWLGKRLSGVSCASIVVLLFSFSLWEIEFSRFARMYCLFQTIFLWYIFFLFKVIVDKDEKAEKWMHLLSFSAIFVYEASIFLLIVNFITLYFIPESRKKFNICLKIVLFITGYFLLAFDFRFLGAENFLPPEINAFLSPEIKADHTHRGGIALPTILVSTLPTNIAWTPFFIILLSATIFLVYRLIRCSKIRLHSKIGLCTILLFSQLNLFGLIIVLFTILIPLDIIVWNSATKKNIKDCLLLVLLSFGFWMAYYFTTAEGHHNVGLTEPSSWKEILLILFNYPDIARNIIIPWMRTMPVFTITSAFIIFLGTLKSLKRPIENDLGYRLLLSLIIILGLLVSTMPLIYHETRYTFFFYPVILLLFVVSMTRLIYSVCPRPLIAACLLLLSSFIFCALTEDFSIRHMKEIDSREINFRINYSPATARHFYKRADYRTPAEIINNEIAEGDIVISTLTPVDYYLETIDYIYIDYRSKRLAGVVACSGKKELWSNAKLIFHEEKLMQIIDNYPSTVWIIAPSDPSRYGSKTSAKKPQGLHSVINKIIQRYNLKRYKTSVDGMIDIYKIDFVNN
jgi:hypothetical protein